MKKITFLVILATLLAIPVNTSFSACEANNTGSYNISYNSEIYEPSESYNNFIFNGTVSILNGVNNSNLRLRYELYSSLRYGMDKYYSSSYVGSKFSYPSTKEINYSFRLNDFDNIAREEVIVKFGLYDTSTKKYLNYINGHLYNKKENRISISSGTTYEYDRLFYLRDEKVTEKYVFNNFSEIVEIKDYYRLDLSSLSFEYYCYKPFDATEACLYLDDEDNIFPYFNVGFNLKTIPLYINNKDNTVNFIFKNLYVNPTTLDMSLVNREGFISTNYFYLPKNKINKLQGFPLTLSLIGGGVNNISFDYDFTINLSSLLIGPCNQSSFCIVGGVVK